MRNNRTAFLHKGHSILTCSSLFCLTEVTTKSPWGDVTVFGAISLFHSGFGVLGSRDLDLSDFNDFLKKKLFELMLRVA